MMMIEQETYLRIKEPELLADQQLNKIKWLYEENLFPLHRCVLS